MWFKDCISISSWYTELLQRLEDAFKSGFEFEPVKPWRVDINKCVLVAYALRFMGKKGKVQKCLKAVNAIMSQEFLAWAPCWYENRRSAQVVPTAACFSAGKLVNRGILSSSFFYCNFPILCLRTGKKKVSWRPLSRWQSYHSLSHPPPHTHTPPLP